MEINFLKKLKIKKIITLKEISENLKKEFLKKSEKFFLSGKLLYNNKYLESSVSDLYYSMYYSLLGLLFGCGVKSENHNASINFLNYLFNRKDLYDIIKKAKKERIDKQYYTKTETNEEEVKELLDKTKKFNFEIKKIIDSLLNEDIEEIRKKFKNI